MKQPIRNLSVEISCKRKGKSPESHKIEWKEPEDKAMETYYKLNDQIISILKTHGLLKDQ